ncbi:thioredoxin family protein [Ascoidea rubescens DSM 1968]|uniref:Thioredoxin-like protein n=1 Tax=Ascoidea rubescens DSM 1968 TaxID=1344418 RepID=A0A1D2VK77_9ASCO|nr:thioredoxin-like protein [Ascoidea rubescens DSM 1968]ODV62021.1 thioredoxin-like protein [Ascoidea rubescens DSM 1968]
MKTLVGSSFFLVNRSFNGSFNRAVLASSFTNRSFSSSSKLFGISEIKTLSELNNKLKENKENLTIVDFFAKWCSPCKAISPVLEKFSENYKNDKVSFYKVDVDDSQDLAFEFGVTAMPTFVLFKNSKPIGKITGANPSMVKSAIEKYK